MLEQRGALRITIRDDGVGFDATQVEYGNGIEKTRRRSQGRGEPELPGPSGIEAIGMLRERWETTEFIALTIHEDHERVFEWFRAGATGYLLKSSPVDKIADRIWTLAGGGSSIDAFIARRVLKTFRGRAPVTPSRSAALLTKREHQILQELASGHCLKQIAATLGVSRHTIDSHVRRIYGKLEARSRAASRVYVRCHVPALVIHSAHLAARAHSCFVIAA